jgi:hypothetical protein
MSPIPRALLKAFLSLAHPKMFLLMLLPVAAAIGLWLVLGIAFWAQAVAWLDDALRGWDALQWLLAYWPLTLLAAHVAWVVLLALMVPVIIVTTILVVGIFAMPIMVSHVAPRNYAELEQLQGGTFVASAGNSFAALAWFALLVLLSSPLWLFPPLWPPLSLGLLGYLNQRVFRYDALAEHATAAEIADLIRRNRSELFLLGVALALVGHVPLVGIVMPVYGGLAFIHYGLARLDELRSEPIQGAATRA